MGSCGIYPTKAVNSVFKQIHAKMETSPNIYVYHISISTFVDVN
jgi:hypothetical protein